MPTTYRTLTGEPSFLAKLVPQELLNYIRDSFFNKFGRIEEWHYIGGSGEPAFQGTWQEATSSTRDTAYYKDPYNTVWLAGAPSNGAGGSTIFTLPEGYRPAQNVLFQVPCFISGTGYTTEQVTVTASTGAVVYGASGPTLGVNDFLHLECIFFRQDV